ncbi:MAG TPA: protein kinase [Gemmatimonadales bacterium]
MSSSLQQQLQVTLGDAYVLERELGGGGMSRVFLALETALGRRVVIKVLLPELAAGVSVERFRREIQLAAQLQHPHIVPLLSAGEAEGLPYFIMPFVTGESLRARVAREGELPIAETVRILRDVVSALAFAHARGVVHRDIKPDNVLISGGVAVVTDFGVAKAVSASSGGGATGKITSLGVALGTPAYMAPEQATASPQTDHRADIYALGAMAYEMLTGAPPFTGPSPQAILAAHVVEEPHPVERRRPGVPPMLATLVRDCLAKRPADRPQAAADVMHALDTIATPTGGTVPTTAILPTPRPAATAARQWPLIAALAALALVVTGAVLWVGRTSNSAGAPTSTSKNQSSATLPRTDTATGAVRGAQPPPAQAPPTPTPAAESVRARRPESKRGEPSRRPRPKPRAVAPAIVSQPTPESTATTDSTTAAAPAAPEPAAPPAAAPPETTRTGPTPTPTVQAPAPVTAPPPAPAQPAHDPRPEIRSVIADYSNAVESQSVNDLRRVYPGMTGLQQRGWEQFFQVVRDVKSQLSITRLDVANDTASAQVTGTYTYMNTTTGRTERQPVSFHAALRREGGQWRISQVR